MATYSILSKTKGHIVSFLHITAATLNTETRPPHLPATDMLATHKDNLKNKNYPTTHTTDTAHRD